MPTVVHVRCHRCSGRAEFRPPYAYVGKEAAASLPQDRLVPRSGGFVVVLFPDVFPWRDPENPHLTAFTSSQPIAGIVVCSNCAALYRHRLAWPKDAYYQFPLSNITVWAWSRDHLVKLSEAVSSPRHIGLSGRRRSRFLRHVPKVVWETRNEARVLSEIRRFLAPPSGA